MIESADFAKYKTSSAFIVSLMPDSGISVELSVGAACHVQGSIRIVVVSRSDVPCRRMLNQHGIEIYAAELGLPDGIDMIIRRKGIAKIAALLTKVFALELCEYRSVARVARLLQS